MLDFLQEFFDAHPELANNDVYITGESYAGHYVPVVSHRIWKYNQAATGAPIHIKGLAIGVLFLCAFLPGCCSACAVPSSCAMYARDHR
jgi:carboxypeptidase C (cathepsin A)